MKKPIGIAGKVYNILQITSERAASEIISFINSPKKTLHITLFALIVYYIIKSAIFFAPGLYMKNSKNDCIFFNIFKKISFMLEAKDFTKFSLISSINDQKK